MRGGSSSRRDCDNDGVDRIDVIYSVVQHTHTHKHTDPLEFAPLDRLSTVHKCINTIAEMLAPDKLV